MIISPSSGMMPDVPIYNYRCVDRSLLVGPFCRYFVRWFVVWVPPGIPANLLTLGSSACMWLMLFLAVTARNVSAIAPWCLLLMAGYVIYDHADGMHSRRTGTSSPLGEYLDHFLDAFHGAIAVVVMFFIAGRADSPLLPILLWAVLVAGAATMVEERERKELYFGLTGPLEAMLLTLFYFASWCRTDTSAWWQVTVVGRITVFDVVMAGGVTGGVLTAAACVRRVGCIPASLLAYMITGAILGIHGVLGGVAWWETALLVILHGGDYTGRVIAGHLRGLRRPWPDFITPVIMLVAWASDAFTIWLTFGLGAYLLARNLVSVSGMFKTFRQFWLWWNVPVCRDAWEDVKPGSAIPS